MTQAEIKDKKRLLAAKLLKKLLSNKMRENFHEVKVNAWKYYNYRTQKKLRTNMQLFKVLSMIQDKMKTQKLNALH